MSPSAQIGQSDGFWTKVTISHQKVSRKSTCQNERILSNFYFVFQARETEFQKFRRNFVDTKVFYHRL